MWLPFISITDLSFLRRGDYVDISITPHSQKYFSDPNYDFYFPNYRGKVISSTARTLDELMIKDLSGKTIYCIDRAGTSGFITGKYYRSSTEEDPFMDLLGGTETD